MRLRDEPVNADTGTARAGWAGVVSPFPSEESRSPSCLENGVADVDVEDWPLIELVSFGPCDTVFGREGPAPLLSPGPGPPS
jgi:hypothetical protein